jgi:uncharacterized protein (DUF2236 family)
MHDVTVSRTDLERSLEKLCAKVQDPRAGLFGPGSKTWEIAREAIVFLGGGRAALLQTAHPFVAHAIEQHSKTKSDPQGRFRRTFENVFAMVFGDLDAALTSARRVHALHERIRGKLSEHVGRFSKESPYAANEEAALLWVHATLCESSVYVYERVVRPLSLAEKEAYYAETRLFAYLFGIPDSVLPRDWKAFAEYNRRMWESDTLCVGRPAGEIAEYLFRPAHPALKPLADWYRLMTAGLLPERIRRQYGFEYGLAERALFETSLRALRAVHPSLPSRLRYLPAYVAARRRLAGKTGPDLVGQALQRAVLSMLKRRTPSVA